MKKFFINLRKVIFLLFFLLCIAIVLTVVTTSGNKVPEIFGFSVLNVSSVSMEPTYNRGDIVVAKAVDAKVLKVKDVISFYSVDPNIYGIPNTHRIVKVIEENDSLKFQTKGDHNEVADSYLVNDDQVIGLVKFKIPYVGKAITFLNNKIAFFMCLILPMMILVFFEVKNIVKISRAEDEEDEEKNC